MEWRWDDNMKWIREMVNTSWNWKLMLLKDLHDFQYHLRIYMNKKGGKCREEFNTSRDYMKD
jgi:hypothetical protein